jgi:hypothetical protein
VSLTFSSKILLPPIPTRAAKAARQAAHLQSRIDAVGIAQVKAEALAAINDVDAASQPSEIKRLRMLYKDVYAQSELKDFIAYSLAVLGFKD